MQCSSACGGKISCGAFCAMVSVGHGVFVGASLCILQSLMGYVRGSDAGFVVRTIPITAAWSLKELSEEVPSLKLPKSDVLEKIETCPISVRWVSPHRGHMYLFFAPSITVNLAMYAHGAESRCGLCFRCAGRWHKMMFRT